MIVPPFTARLGPANWPVLPNDLLIPWQVVDAAGTIVCECFHLQPITNPKGTLDTRELRARRIADALNYYHGGADVPKPA